MTYEREDFEKLLDEKRRDKINGQRQNLEIIRQAAVKSQLLTGDPNWDTFLSYLQEADDTLNQELESRKAALCDPQRVDPNDIMGLKMRIAQLEAQIATIETIMTLPKSLKEQGDKAEDLLSRLNG